MQWFCAKFDQIIVSKRHSYIFFEDTDALSINLKRYLRCDYFLVWRFENWKFINPNERNRTWVESDVWNEFFPFF